MGDPMFVVRELHSLTVLPIISDRLRWEEKGGGGSEPVS
jgi:hypothetical protein